MVSNDGLEEKSGRELDKLTREEQARLDKLLTTNDPDFGLGGPPELLPVSDEEVNRMIDGLERAIKMRNIVLIRAKQRAVLEGIQRRQSSELAERDRILRHGFQTRRRDPSRTALPSRPRQPMFEVDLPCAKCGTNVHELSFEPTPGRAVYCPDCYQEVRHRGGSQTTVVGDALNRGLQEENERLRAELEAGGGGQNFSDKGPRRKHRKKQQVSDSEDGT